MTNEALTPGFLPGFLLRFSVSAFQRFSVSAFSFSALGSPLSVFSINNQQLAINNSYPPQSKQPMKIKISMNFIKY